MPHAKSIEFKSQGADVVSRAIFTTVLVTNLVRVLKSVFKTRFDPTRLTPAQRCDAGIDQCEVERFEALNRPLIR